MDELRPEAPSERRDRVPGYFPEPPEPRRLITTFYSFKGGVGRSMAMQGAAMALAARRQRVLMVDADMEAPGLTLVHVEPGREQCQGFADIAATVAQRVIHALETGDEVNPDAFDDLPAQVTRALKPLTAPAAEDQALVDRVTTAAALAGVDVPPPGVVALLPVGRVFEDYAAALADLGLDRLFGPDSPDAPPSLLCAAGLPIGGDPPPKVGDVFAQVLRGALLRATHPDDGRPFDHVFVDSRTGLADIAGLCVRWLADRLVVLLGLNEQNIRGTRRILEKAALGADGPRGVARVTVVVSPVPGSELRMLAERLADVKGRLELETDPLLLHYEPWVALSDRPLTEEWHQHTRLRGDHLRLSRRIEEAANLEPELWLPRMLWLLARDEPHFAEAATRLAHYVLAEPARAPTVAAYALSAITGRPLAAEAVPLLRIAAAAVPRYLPARGMFADARSQEASRLYRAGDQVGGRRASDEAEKEYAAAIDIDPRSDAPWNNWGNALDDWAQALAPTDLPAALPLWEGAETKYARAVEMKPDEHEAWYNWGNALGCRGRALAPTDLPAALRLWEGARTKYARAVEIKPDLHEAWSNWGSALNASAQALAPTDLPEALRLWEEAGTKYARAVETKPDLHEAWNNWGAALHAWARALAPTDLPEAVRLWEEAGTKYARAVEIKPDLHEAWGNWGSALDDWATALAPTDLPAALRLWEEAGTKCARAVDIKPDKHAAWYNWGGALLSRWHYQRDPALLEEAHDKLLRAEQAKPGSATYNLACWAALSGKADEAFEGLATALENAEVKWDHITGDRDWDELRDDPRYKRLEAAHSSG